MTSTIARRAAVRTLLFLLLAMSVVSWTASSAIAQSTPAATPAGSPVAAQTIAITGAVLTPLELTVEDLQSYPAETVDVTFTAGGESEDHSFTGTPLLGLIEAAGLDVPEDARNPLLTHYLVITATDGYQIVLSGGELDPNFGNAPILLAWEQDDAALDAENAPARLVVPGDSRGGRYVSGVISIEVVALPAAS